MNKILSKLKIYNLKFYNKTKSKFIQLPKNYQRENYLLVIIKSKNKNKIVSTE